MNFTGKWRISEMDTWDQEAFDLLGPAYFSFSEDRLGEFRFIAVHGSMDCQYSERDGRPFVEFTWEGDDEGHPTCGRGWALIEKVGTLTGHIYIHQGDDSGFRAIRATKEEKAARPKTSKARKTP